MREDAVLADAADFLRPDDLEKALGQVTKPVVLLRAPLGMFNQEPPLYPDPAVTAGRQRLPQLTDVLIPGVNHYTIALTSRGAQATADVVRGHLTG